MSSRFIWFAVFFFILSGNTFAEKGSLHIDILPAPPNLKARVQFSEPSGNNILDAEETGRLTITVTNTGRGDAFDLTAVLEPDRSIQGLELPGQVVIGTVPAGEKRSVEIPLRASRSLPTSKLGLRVEVREANGFDADPVKIVFQTRAFVPPKLIIAEIGIDDQNGNARVEPMEIVELTARVQNIGYGDARDVVVEVKTGRNVFIAGDGVTHFELGNLRSGQFRDIKFMFYTNKRIKNGERIPVTIDIREARPGFGAVQALDLVMNARQKRTEEIVVEAVEGPEEKIELARGLSVDVDMEIPSGNTAGPYDVAVVIGNRRYTTLGVPEVAYAHRDARIMKEYLLRTFGFREENIIYVEDATFAKFNEIFGSDRDPRGKLYNFVKPGESRVFVYYVGHGAPDLTSHEAYFVPVDANPQYISTNGYRLETFYRNLASLPVKGATIVLDACFSGNTPDGMLFRNISPLMVKVKKDYRGPGNATVLASAAMDQVSTWYPEKRHSLFTYYFLKGLKGEADTDGNRVITVREMKDYLRENVPYMARRLNAVEQVPVVRGDEEEVLVRLIR
jgi:hypothetical protein